ncbi:MAG: hypothetical protein M3373_00010 [Gemmatimonadota bacterium]|nr:hypothetical protein [Gemmatimonadota bacterium]
MNATRFVSILAGVLVASACSADRPTSPLQPEPPSLTDLEQSEQDRVEERAVESEVVYDSLIVEWATGQRNRNPAVTWCEPEHYAAVVQIVGPEGATLAMGSHRLQIPPGALEDSVVITAEVEVDLVTSVRLSPHGLRFDVPPILTLDYEHCEPPGWARTRDHDDDDDDDDDDDRQAQRVAYITDDEQVLELPVATDRPASKVVEALLEHFSRYAVAY